MEDVGSKLLPHALDTYEMITGDMIELNKGKAVCLLGKIEEAKESSFKLACTHSMHFCITNYKKGKSVKVINYSTAPPLGTKISEGMYVEVRGLLTTDQNLQFHDLVPFGNEVGILKI